MLSINTTKLRSIAYMSLVVFTLSSCGVILHPERKGQRAGRLDPAIVVLDAVGLLLFFVPGVVAFAVDFATGTIYLSGGRRAELSQGELDALVQQSKVQQSDIVVLLQRKGLLSTDIDVNAWVVIPDAPKTLVDDWLQGADSVLQPQTIALQH